MWKAYIDESESDRAADPETYLLGAAILDVEDLAEVRESMAGLLLRGQRKLHWRDESEPRRRKITEHVAELPALHVIVVRSGVADESSERRRRICLERLLHELHQAHVDHMYLEARESKQNQRDRRLLDAARQKRLVSGALRMDHVPGPVEPLLWLPDVVLGAISAYRVGRSEHFERLADLVEIHTADL